MMLGRRRDEIFCPRSSYSLEYVDAGNDCWPNSASKIVLDGNSAMEYKVRRFSFSASLFRAFNPHRSKARGAFHTSVFIAAASAQRLHRRSHRTYLRRGVKDERRFPKPRCAKIHRRALGQDDRDETL